LFQERSLGSRNDSQITAKQWSETVDYLHDKWSPQQIANQVGISHETIYHHVYADKATGGSLWKELRCQNSERPAYIEERVQVGHWEGDTVIGGNHKQAIVTL
jgi:IS30 family transposase